MDASPALRTDPHAATRSITRLSVIVAVALIVMKAFALGASGSVSMLATLTDSALDLAASLTAFFAVRWAAAPPDEAHRFGHEKGEAMAALVQSGLICASAVFVGWEAVARIVDPRPVGGGAWSVGVMLVSMALTAWLIWMQGRALKRSGSLAVAGDRAHYSADLSANAVVLIGVASGALLDAPGLDAAAGLIVAVWLFWGAMTLMRAAADPLLDHEAPARDSAAVAAAVSADPRILGVHRLRTRLSGTRLAAQMHVDLEAALTLAEAHAIVEEAEKRVLAAFPQADVIIHADPRPVAAAGATGVPSTPPAGDPSQ